MTFGFMNMKWLYRLGFILLLFVVSFVFLKLKPVWMPVLSIVGKVLIPFITAAFVGYLLYPIVENLHKRGVPRSVCIIAIYSLFFGGLAVAFYKGIPIMVAEVNGLLQSTPEITGRYEHFLNIIEERTNGLPEQITERIGEGIVFFEEKAEGFLVAVLTHLVNVFDYIVIFAIIPLIAFYYIKDWKQIKKAAWYITPPSIRKQGISFMKDLEQSLGSYIRGQLLVCAIIGILSAGLLWMLQVKYSLLLGLFIGITNVIPYFGPIIGMIPAVIVAAASDGGQVLWVVIIVFGLQFLEGNVLSPMIIGKSLHMHPLLIMLSLYVGGEIGGVLGLVLAVPVLSIIRVSIMHAKAHFIRERQRMIGKQQDSE